MTPPAVRPWWEQGEAFFAAAADRVADADLDGPCLLPGWTRRMLVAHAAGNADALVNLCTWAATGVETPMYASPDARQRSIDAGAALAAAELRRRAADASRRLADAVAAMPAAGWDAEVRTAQGRMVPASDVLWMRCREVWVHAVDLDAGVGFADVPPDVLAALLDDVVRTWRARDELPDVRLGDGTRTWTDGPVTVEADLAELVAYVTGRLPATDGTSRPVLPRWV